MDPLAPAADTVRDREIEGNQLVRPEEGASPAVRPTFVAYDTPPALQNAGEMQRLLEQSYPKNFKDAGIGDRVELWLVRRPDGRRGQPRDQDEQRQRRAGPRHHGSGPADAVPPRKQPG